MEYWPVSGQLSVPVLNYQLQLYSQANDALTSKLYYGIKWEEPEVNLFNELAKKSSCTLDIGGNIGLYSLIASKANPTSYIYCFEPNPNNVKRIKKNIYINQSHSNIQLIETAVGRCKGQIPFYLPEGNKISDVSSVYKVHTESFSDFKMSKINVDVIAIDDFIQNQGIIPDLIKIDVELYELEVFEGMKSFLSNYSPVVICEVFNDIVKCKQNPALAIEVKKGFTNLVERFLTEHGYRFYLISRLGVLRVNNLSSNPESSMYMFTKKKITEDFVLQKDFKRIAEELFL